MINGLQGRYPIYGPVVRSVFAETHEKSLGFPSQCLLKLSIYSVMLDLCVDYVVIDYLTLITCLVLCEGLQNDGLLLICYRPAWWRKQLSLWLHIFF